MTAQAKTTLFKANLFKRAPSERGFFGFSLFKPNLFMPNLFKAMLAAAVVVVALAVILESALASTFTVNSTGDAADTSTGDGTCYADAATDGQQCTLRAAIQQANVSPGADVIHFDIPGGGAQTISPASPLPDITGPVTIDGTTQPGYADSPIIELSGANAGSSADGLKLTGAGSTVRGLVINSFKQRGIFIFTANGNRIEGNFIGTDISGTTDRGNYIGVWILGSSNNVVGGTTPEARNIISGNDAHGVSANTSGVFGPSADNRVQGNYVGTDKTGTLDLGNTQHGVLVSNAPNNLVGGTEAGARNVVSGNNGHGVYVSGFRSSSNQVQGNYIGTGADGITDLGNSHTGVFVEAAANNTVGGTAAGAGNTVAFNDRDGVRVSLNGGTGNSILSNSISSNGGLGIDLSTVICCDGRTANDDKDPDTGPNNLQNYPDLVSAFSSSSSTIVSGNLNSIPGTTFNVQFFSGAQPDPSGYGEGQIYLGQRDVTTDGGGNASFDFVPASIVPAGQVVTATATSPGGDTSEFSRAVTVVADTAAPSTTATTSPQPNAAGWNNSDVAVTLDASDNSGGSGVKEITYSTAGAQNTAGTTTSGNPARVNVTTEGETTITYAARDKVDNTEGQKTLTIKLDKTAPAAPTISGPAGDSYDTDGAFVVSGMAEPDSTVELFEDTHSQGKVTTDSSGTWSVALADVAEGSHTYEAKATDAADNTSPSSSAVTVKVDKTPPAAPAVDLDAASDTGASDTDGITSDATPTFKGTAEPDSTVAVYDGGVGLDTTTADSNSGSWTFTPTGALTEGVHHITAAATDAAGNTSSASSELNVTIDTVAPETNIDPESEPTDPSNSPSASFGFSSSEADSTFRCSLDGAPYQGCASPREYRDLSGGSHAFEVRATDQAGNEDQSPATYSWAVDSTAPDAPIIKAPINNSYSTDKDLNISGTAETGSTVKISESGSELSGSPVTATDGAWEIVLTGVSEGEHTYRAMATDAAGNESEGAGVTVTVDTVAPETNIESKPQDPTTDTSASFGFSSSEADSSFECALDDDSFVACSSPESYPDLTQGQHTFQVRATDKAGNLDATPASYSWTIGVTPPEDTTAPDAPTITSPGDGSYNNTGNIVLKGLAEADSRVDVLEGSTGVTGSPVTATGGNWELDLTGVKDGAHTYAATATDAAGNTSDRTTVRVTVDTLAPETSINSEPPKLTNSPSASFGFASGEAGSTFRCSLDGAPYQGCSSPQEYSDLSEGSHSFEVKATDQAGNEDQSPATYSWMVDTEPPGAPSITSPANNSYNTGKFTVSGTAEVASSVELFEGARSQGKTIADGSTGKWSISLSGVAEGAHTYTAKSTDATGNVSDASGPVTVFVDITPPSIGKVSPQDGATKVSIATTVTATFFEKGEMDANTLTTDTFKLEQVVKNKPGPAPVTARVSYDPATKTVTLAPVSNLQAGASYKATIARTVTDKAGNPIVGNKAGGGTRGDYVWYFSTAK